MKQRDIDFICEGLREALSQLPDLEFGFVQGIIDQKRLVNLVLIPQSQRKIMISVPQSKIKATIEN